MAVGVMKNISVFVGTLMLSLVVYWIGDTVAVGESQLDSTFGSSGIVRSDFGFGDDEVFDLAIQNDQKIVVAGYISNGAVNTLAVARYNTDGTLDNSFNYDGVYTYSLGDGNSSASSVLLQEDGKIIVAGLQEDGDGTLALLRLTADGYSDNSFGDNGILSLDLEAGRVVSSELLFDEQDRILVAGSLGEDENRSKGYVARFLTSGEKDESFGESGYVVLTRESGVKVNGIAVQDGGAILVGGEKNSEEGQPQALAFRLTDVGELDTTFGTEGDAVYESLGAASVTELLVDDGNGIYLAGVTGEGEARDSYVLKADAAGQLETSFAEQGVYRSELGNANQVHDMTIVDGTLLLVGFSETDGEKDLYVLAIDTETDTEAAAESEDSSGGEFLSVAEDSQETLLEEAEAAEEVVASSWTADLASNDDIGYAVQVSSAGEIVVAGTTNNGSDNDFALVRYASNALSTSFSSSNSSPGTREAGYYIETTPVSGVSRVGAVSGGTIADTDTLSCNTRCTEQCTEDDVLDETCFDECEADCEAEPTVVQRGVVYGVHQYPSYREETDDDDDDTTDDEDNGLFPNTGKDYLYDTVRSGQTNDGSGVGLYSSDILEVTPDTLYYVRAYALLSDDTVIYGNVVSFKTNDACFIATAAYGSIFERHVVILRDFRDTVLLASEPGKYLVSKYYEYSPALADIIVKSEILQLVTRILLLPFVALAYVAIHGAPGAWAGLLGVLLLAGIYGMTRLQFNKAG